MSPSLVARILSILTAASLLSPVALNGQPETAPAHPTFRTSTAAVLLDIVVRDKRGRPVRDLRADEVTVLEDGQPREIRSFRLIDGGTMPSVLETAMPATPQPDPLRRITLVSLVFDHLSQNGRRLASKAALDFVSRELPEGQWVAVFVIDGRVRRLQDFTRRSDALKAAVERAAQVAAREDPDVSPAQSRERTARPPELGEAAANAPPAGGPGDSSALGGSLAERAMAEVRDRMQLLSDSAELQQRGQSTLFPLMALASAQRSLEGRKAILFFSEGFQVPVNMEEAFRSTISEANRANVSFYTVDARGLDTGRALESAAATLNRAGRTSQQEQLDPDGPVSIAEVMNSETAQSALGGNRQATLEELAASTGGFLIANSNDLRKGLERVSGDLTSYYEIAYSPASGELDGRFRKVEVKVARRGVNVQARSGYFALPATDDAPLMPYELPLLGALTEPSPPHPFEYRASMFRFHSTPRGRQYTLLVEVPLEHLTFEEDTKARQYALRFAVMAVVKDAQGRAVERMSNAYPLEGPLERLPALKLGNIIFKRQLWLAPGRYTVGIVAHDQASDRASVQHIELDVPLSAPGVHVSTPAIIRRVDPAGENADVVEDPFRSGPMRIVPSLDVPISRATNSQISAFVIIYPDASAATKPELTFEFMREGAVIGRGTPVLPDPDERGRVSYVATFPTEGFEPGTYEVRAVARQGATHDESRTRFTVIP